MRIIAMHKTNAYNEAGHPPPPEMMAAMGQLVGSMMQKGVLVATEGLCPSSQGARLTFLKGKRTVSPGPLKGENELMAGFGILRVRNLDEAIAWATKFAETIGDTVIDVRPLSEPWDIGAMPKPDRDFDATQWNRHSVQLPWQLARQMPHAIHVEDPYAFFYPCHNDPVHHYMWGERPALRALATRLAKNVVKGALMRLKRERDPARQWFYDSYHGLRGADWHARQLARAYCLHLWEGLWGERYLKRVDVHYLLHDASPFAKALREVLGSEELRELASPPLFSTCLQSRDKAAGTRSARSTRA